MLIPDEPYRLKRHNFKDGQMAGCLFTCARPGRSMGAKKAKIGDDVVDAWIAGIGNEVDCGNSRRPLSNEQIIMISLLGRKPNGLSEFSYYSFRGGFDRPEDRPGCPTWQAWLTG